ncbi:MAG: ABC transporter ATP-binding protein [Thermomicrobiales bacterium]|nr:ABC transporter ATP-binding protein [Thermomicrobiales bacterium]MCO5218612.1 ABC transporter ATP-binding protein [Thermomicrobiales bacterium]MCO5224289.1 ABC transporter ATP-binding protein [Thermomicrobiales bacterium]MCO5229006.1 ABC transporter ATP-binding protein [Thermomicrobiales bacterium]
MAASILTVDRLSRHFGTGDSRVDAVKQASFEIQAGEIVALVGPSGSGKSTLLSIAGALLRPSEGVVKLGGRDISSLKGTSRTRMRLESIGFIFQGSNLVSFLTALEQLQFMGKMLGLSATETDVRAKQLLEELGMEKRMRHYPEQMSGGERQRVAIARALMNEPELVLADEPTASLDSQRGRQVVELLADEVHRREVAGIIVTHDERLIDVCDRVLRISDGEVREE